MFKDIFKFTDLIDRIDACIDLYEKVRLEDTRFKLYLSDGKEIQISYDIKSIPHLLGINIDYLRSTGMYEESSYNILVDIINNPNRLFNQFKNKHMKPESVFSKHINEKLDNFENICGINIHNIEFISHYDKEKSYTNGNNPLDGEYYIGFRNSSKTLSVIGFTKNHGMYYPITNLKFDYYSNEKEDFLNRLLNNQTLLSLQTLKKNTFINGLIDPKKYYYHLDEKEAKLLLLNKYAENYKATCDTHKDYIYYIRKTMNLYEEKSTIWDILVEITEAIKKKKIINIPKLEKKYGELKGSFVNTISAYNDSLTNNENSTENNFSYKDIIEELKVSKTEVERLNNLINKVDNENKKLVERNCTLEEENKELKDKEVKIRQILG